MGGGRLLICPLGCMPSVQLLFGPLLIGAFLNCILYGIMIMQMLVYYQTYKNDSAWMYFLIAFLFIAETVNTGFTIGLLYQPLIMESEINATKFFPTMLAAEPIVTVFISTPIQIFIAHRIRIISREIWLTVIISVFALISIGGGIWLTYTVTAVRLFERKPELHWPAIMWLASSAVADVIITLSLSYSLSRRKTGFSGTDEAINRIIRLTLQTGLITAVFALLDVICFLLLPHTTINFVWDLSLSKLYTNALLSTLNARTGWGDVVDGMTLSNVLYLNDTTSRAHSQSYPSSSMQFNSATAADRGEFATLEPGNTETHTHHHS